MPINRAPYNALIDDDGSGLTGSVWNKAAIKNVLLDPVDAALAPPWIDQPFNVANFWPGVTAAHVTANRYGVQGRTLIWNLQMNGSAPLLGTSASLPFILPGGVVMIAAGAGASFVRPAYCQENSTLPESYGVGTGPSSIAFLKHAGGNWSGVLVALYFTAVIQLQ